MRRGLTDRCGTEQGAPAPFLGLVHSPVACHSLAAWSAEAGPVCLGPGGETRR